jgi:hypothetical protein
MQLVRLAHELCSAGFFVPLFSHIILFILPAEHYSFYQPNTTMEMGRADSGSIQV